MNAEIIKLEKRLTSAGIFCTQKQLSDFEKYYNLLLAWRDKTNLVSQADIHRLVERHFLESLSILASLKIEFDSHILDVGSGAGFPLLPISILRRDIHFVAVESKRMKVLFLKEVISQLKLINVVVLHERCEKLSQDLTLVRHFDYIFTRAVGALVRVYQWVEPLLKSTGEFIAWKGGDVNLEIEELQKQFKNLKINIEKMDPNLVSKQRKRVFVKARKMEAE